MKKKKKPNASEQIVIDNLIHQGYNTDNILYEPEKNSPPDLLLEKEDIAIEVRRLN